VAFPGHDPANREQVVINVRPHWYGLVVPALTVPVVVLLAVVGLSFVSARVEGEAIQYAIGAVAVGLLVKFSVLPWLRRITTRYVLTTERLVVSMGIVRRSRIDIPLSHIDEVGSRSSIIENLFGCGTLVVSSRDGHDMFALPRMPNVTDVGLTLHRLARSTGG